MSDIPPDTVLSCGCVVRCAVEDGVRTMFYIPCHTDCAAFIGTLARALMENMPVEERHLP